MFSVLCKYMEKLENQEVSIEECNAMSKLVGQANNLLNYELKRAALMMNTDFKQQHRNLEIKAFDTLPEPKNSNSEWVE